MHGEVFPREVTGGVPRLTLTGREQLHVEQHRGLIDYAPESIVLRTSCGLLRVAGAGMVFNCYTATEAIVSGRIDSVAFQHGEGGR